MPMPKEKKGGREGGRRAGILRKGGVPYLVQQPLSFELLRLGQEVLDYGLPRVDVT